MKYQGRTEIAARIMQAASTGNGASASDITSSTYLSYSETKKYLAILADNNLLEYDKHSGKYKTTRKGINFLDLYNDVGILFKKIAEA